MKTKTMIVISLGLVFAVFSCKKEPTYKGEHDPDVIKNYHNEAASVSEMDSAASVNFIAKQKLTEIYELSSLYSYNSGDSLMRSILYPQLQSYFLKNDSLSISNLISEMDSLQVHFVEIDSLSFPPEDSLGQDSVRLVNYGIKLYSEDKKLKDYQKKSAQFILKKEPKKFKNEFIFYFVELNRNQEPKDTISSGVTQ